MREEKISELWELTAEVLLAALRDPDRCTPPMVQAALRFLSDNHVEVVDTGEGKLDEIFRSLPFKKAE